MKRHVLPTQVGHADEDDEFQNLLMTGQCETNEKSWSSRSPPTHSVSLWSSLTGHLIQRIKLIWPSVKERAEFAFNSHSWGRQCSKEQTCIYRPFLHGHLCSFTILSVSAQHMTGAPRATAAEHGQAFRRLSHKCVRCAGFQIHRLVFSCKMFDAADN